MLFSLSLSLRDVAKLFWGAQRLVRGKVACGFCVDVRHLDRLSTCLYKFGIWTSNA